MMWTPERVEIARRAYMEGGIGALRQAFPEAEDSSLQAMLARNQIRRGNAPRSRPSKPSSGKSGAAPALNNHPANVSKRSRWGDESPNNTARHSETLQPVPKAVVGLPWVSYPRDRETGIALIRNIENARALAAERGEQRSILAFFDSTVAYIRAVAAIEEQSA